MSQISWASKEYFRKNIKDNSLCGYFQHKKNGYQIYRHKKITKFLKDNINKKIISFLDIGCAKGDLTYKIFSCINIDKALGIDFIDELITIAKHEYPMINFKTDRLPDLNLGDEKYDLILLSEVIYYIKDIDKVLEVINLFINENGYLCITSNMQKNNYSLSLIKDMLINNNFKIKKIDYSYMSFYNKIIFPLSISTQIIAMIKNNQLPNNIYGKKLIRIILLINKRINIIKVISKINKTMEPIISSIKLPKILDNKIFSKTNYLLLAQIETK